MIMPAVLAVFLVACGGGGSRGGGSGAGGSGGGSSPTTIVPFGTKQMGVAGVVTDGNSAATDSSGNVYVAGVTMGGLDGNTLTGTKDFFLTKYNAAGTKVYTKQLGVAGAATIGLSVATDSSGNVYVAGFTEGGLDGNTLTGTEDFFLTKYNAAGNKVYTKQLGVPGVATYGNSVATDSHDNVYVAGSTEGGLDGNTLTGATDFFLTQYNAAGTKIYTKQLGVPGAGTDGLSVATDSHDNVYVAGYTSGGLDGNTLTGLLDFFLTKYDAVGTKVYTKQMGATSGGTLDRFAVGTSGNSVATDSSGNVYVAGDTAGEIGR
ncbi:MAG: SBBP repeat-containing protein, partial [Acidiferrobacterales bacterium]